MKQIGIIRTSTIKQEVESQRAELLKYMINDGCKESDIVIIGQAGASAIKLDDAYMKNMNQVYKLINEGDVSCIYAYALDRIGRNEEFLVKFKNTCINSKVQLKIMNPYMFLLNEDGSVNNGMEMMFSLHIIHAKQEMNDKSSRFKRAKERNKAEGKYNGGFVPYGYSIDEGGYYQINPEEADIIRLVFSLFSTGKYSTKTLSDELKDRGVGIDKRKIRNILIQKAYIGEGNKSLTYKAIINEDLFNTCKEVLAGNNKNQGKSTKRYSLAAKLIRCPECGNYYVANSNKTYICSARQSGYKECHNNVMISSVELDKVLLSMATTNELLSMQVDRVKTVESINKEKEEIELKLAVLREKAEKETKTKLERVKELYIDGDLTKEEYNVKVEKIKNSTNSINTKIIEYENKLEDLKNRLSFLSNPFKPYDPLTATQKDKYELVHRNISSVSVSRISTKGYEVVIVCGGITYTYHYYSQRKEKWYLYEGEKEILATGI